jgi:hypothetical protein
VRPSKDPHKIAPPQRTHMLRPQVAAMANVLGLRGTELEKLNHRRLNLLQPVQLAIFLGPDMRRILGIFRADKCR